jgi:hypothetical protein
MAEENGKADTNAAGWAGVVQQMLAALGSAAKYAVIVAGILIALYFFTEQSNKARQEGEKINEEKVKDADKRLASAQSQLLNTYTQFQEIGTRQVNNLKEVLDLREQVDKQENTKRDEIQEIEGKLKEDKRQEAQLIEEEARLNKELAQRQTLLTAKSNELLHQQTLLDQARLDFEKARLDSAQKSSEKEKADRARVVQLTERATAYKQIRDILTQLARAVETDSKDTKSLAHNVLHPVQDIKQNLKTFVRAPNTENLETIKPIIGLSRNEIAQLDFKDAGFSLYLCGSKIGNSENGCVAAISQDMYTYNGILIITFKEDLVVEMDYIKTLLVVALHAADDWDKKITGIRTISPDGNDFDLQEFVGDTWTFGQLIRSEEKDAQINVVFDNVNRPLSTLTPEKYQSLFSDDYRAAIDDNNFRGEPAVNFAMERRAENFRAANIRGVALVPREVLQPFNQLAGAAVERKGTSGLSGAGDPALEPGFLGRFGAVLLKRDFQIVGYQPSAGDTNAAAIIAEYHPLETGPETRKATFQFRRPGAGAPWRLSSMDIATQQTKH